MTSSTNQLFDMQIGLQPSSIIQGCGAGSRCSGEKKYVALPRFKRPGLVRARSLPLVLCNSWSSITFIFYLGPPFKENMATPFSSSPRPLLGQEQKRQHGEAAPAAFMIPSASEYTAWINGGHFREELQFLRFFFPSQMSCLCK